MLIGSESMARSKTSDQFHSEVLIFHHSFQCSRLDILLH